MLGSLKDKGFLHHGGSLMCTGLLHDHRLARMLWFARQVLARYFLLVFLH